MLAELEPGKISAGIRHPGCRKGKDGVIQALYDPPVIPDGDDGRQGQRDQDADEYRHRHFFRMHLLMPGQKQAEQHHDKGVDDDGQHHPYCLDPGKGDQDRKNQADAGEGTAARIDDMQHLPDRQQ